MPAAINKHPAIVDTADEDIASRQFLAEDFKASVLAFLPTIHEIPPRRPSYLHLTDTTRIHPTDGQFQLVQRNHVHVRSWAPRDEAGEVIGLLAKESVAVAIIPQLLEIKVPHVEILGFVAIVWQVHWQPGGLPPGCGKAKIKDVGIGICWSALRV